VFVIMIACGWTRVPWTRVALASLFSSALYLPLMLYLVIVFGDALDDRVGLWTWPFLLGLIVALAFMRYRVFTYREPPQSAAEASALNPRQQRRPAMAARYRTRTVQLPEFMRLNALPRATRRPRLQ
jgi:hypothetical protein